MKMGWELKNGFLKKVIHWITPTMRAPGRARSGRGNPMDHFFTDNPFLSSHPIFTLLLAALAPALLTG
jgi:hypothetical protein